MPKPTKLKALPARRAAPIDLDAIRFRRRVTINCGILLVLLIGGAVGHAYLRSYVEHKLAFPKSARGWC